MSTFSSVKDASEESTDDSAKRVSSNLIPMIGWLRSRWNVPRHFNFIPSCQRVIDEPLPTRKNKENISQIENQTQLKDNCNYNSVPDRKNGLRYASARMVVFNAIASKELIFNRMCHSE